MNINPRKVLLVGVMLIVSGWVGFSLGEQKLKVNIKNWKPAIVYNKTPAGVAVETEGDFSKFWMVWDKVSELYVDKTALDANKMIDGAISGMVASLGDPYTSYYTVQENKESKEDLGGEFEGVGIQLGYNKDKNLVVMSALDGSPAKRAGLKSGDLIIKVKDTKAKVEEVTQNISILEAVKIIRGEKGTKVILTIAREGVDKPFDVELTRDTIVVKSVELEYKCANIEENCEDVAWVRLSRFGDKTREEWSIAMNEISNKEGVKGMVLDVRNNPGGYLDGAVYVAGEFLQPNKVVVIQQYGLLDRTEDKVDRNGKMLKMPLTVLVNQGSASASEILSGALQDYKRAKIVGMTTFGKGSVQQPEDFPDQSGVHVTVAKWLRPSGEWIDKLGIKPDYEVEEGEDIGRDLQLEKALSLFK